MNILSVQSTVTFGHVGNRAAILPLAALGHTLWPVDTVAFSNHPGHGRFAGRVTPAGEIAAILEGLAGIGVWSRCDAVLSGYLGEAQTGGVLADALPAIRQANPSLLYLCDPVIGDVDQPGGIGRRFVRDGVAEMLVERLVPLADIVTPNRFELEQLTGREVRKVADARTAATTLLERGPRLVVVTSFDGTETPAGSIDTLAFAKDAAWRVRSPAIDRRFDGAGDCFAALLLGFILSGGGVAGGHVPEAVAKAVGTLLPILRRTEEAGGRDLEITASLADIQAAANTSASLAAEPL